MTVHATFKKRLAGGIIDFIFVSILMCIILCISVLPFYISSDSRSVMPFVIAVFIQFPMYIISYVIQYPPEYNEMKLIYLIFIEGFIIEVLYYSILEILPLKGTIGHICTKTRVLKIDGNSPNIFLIIFRNCLKTISRYLLGIPLLTILFTEKRQALHDLLTDTIVVDK